MYLQLMQLRVTRKFTKNPEFFNKFSSIKNSKIISKIIFIKSKTQEKIKK